MKIHDMNWEALDGMEWPLENPVCVIQFYKLACLCVSGARNRWAGAGGGTLLQTDIPLPISRDYDKMDQGHPQPRSGQILTDWLIMFGCKRIQWFVKHTAKMSWGQHMKGFLRELLSRHYRQLRVEWQFPLWVDLMEAVCLSTPLEGKVSGQIGLHLLMFRG